MIQQAACQMTPPARLPWPVCQGIRPSRRLAPTPDPAGFDFRGVVAMLFVSPDPIAIATAIRLRAAPIPARVLRRRRRRPGVYVSGTVRRRPGVYMSGAVRQSLAAVETVMLPA